MTCSIYCWKMNDWKCPGIENVYWGNNIWLQCKCFPHTCDSFLGDQPCPCNSKDGKSIFSSFSQIKFIPWNSFHFYDTRGVWVAKKIFWPSRNHQKHVFRPQLPNLLTGLAIWSLGVFFLYKSFGSTGNQD